MNFSCPYGREAPISYIALRGALGELQKKKVPGFTLHGDTDSEVAFFTTIASRVSPSTSSIASANLLISLAWPWIKERLSLRSALGFGARVRRNLASRAAEGDVVMVGGHVRSIQNGSELHLRARIGLHSLHVQHTTYNKRCNKLPALAMLCCQAHWHSTKSPSCSVVLKSTEQRRLS